MKEKAKNIYTIILCTLVFISLVLVNVFTPFQEFSLTERRYLAKFSKPNTETILNGTWMTDFEKYSQDQFFQRDFFRFIKAKTAYNIFHNLDNNKLYQANNHLSKLEYPANEKMWKHAVDIFNKIASDLFNENNNLYFCIIPDKNYYLAKENGYLSLDYDKCFSFIKENLPSMQEIQIHDLLTIDDYYYTDTHWKQSNLKKVLYRLAEKMDFKINTPFNEKQLDIDFYGVYVGQSAINWPPEKIMYLTNNILENALVYYLTNDGFVSNEIYDFKKIEAKDPYEFFLSGNQSIITIENDSFTTDKELIVFRDSFGSSLCPLLVEGYKKITIIDIRYISSNVLKNYISNTGQDVLFLYSTLLINNSSSLK